MSAIDSRAKLILASKKLMADWEADVRPRRKGADNDGQNTYPNGAETMPIPFICPHCGRRTDVPAILGSIDIVLGEVDR